MGPPGSKHALRAVGIEGLISFDQYSSRAVTRGSLAFSR